MSCNKPDDPTRFVLVEVYRNAEAPAQHKATAHYQAWAAVALDMMAEPRTRADLRQRLPRRRRLVDGHAVRIRHCRAHPLRRRRGAGGCTGRRRMGRRALLVTGASRDRAAALRRAARSCRSRLRPFAVPGEPTVELLRAGTRFARGEGCDLVIAVGGGSAIDAGKALAALLANPGDPLDYLEVIGAGRPLRAALRSIHRHSHHRRYRLRGHAQRRAGLARTPRESQPAQPAMLPRLAVVDPELTLDLPPAITASTGLDALTQFIEPYVSVRANPMTDLLCVEGIRRGAARPAARVGKRGDRAARRGNGVGQPAGRHGVGQRRPWRGARFRRPLGGMFPAPHGAVCAALLPHVMEVNVRALRARDPGGERPAPL